MRPKLRGAAADESVRVSCPLIEHLPRDEGPCLELGRTFIEIGGVHGDAAGDHAPVAFALRAARGVLFDESMPRQLAQVIARRTGGFTEAVSQLTRGRRPKHHEPVEEVHAQRVRERLERRGVHDAV